MSAIPKLRLTETEYLAIESKADFKSEFYRGEMFAMAGASREHNYVKENLVVEIGSRLRGTLCRTLSGDQRLKVSATGFYTYPDIVIVCGKPEYDSIDRDSLINPVVVIEILSPSPEKYDRGAKFRQYQQLESVKEYVLVSQEVAVCESFVRQAYGTWNLTIVTDLQADFEISSVKVRIPMADIYNGVDFSYPQPT